MGNDDLNACNKEELAAIRHAGTVYAAAVAIIAALHRGDQVASAASFYLKTGLAFLLIGTAGSVCYQLLTIQVRGQRMTFARNIAAWCVGVGSFGFIALVVYVLES